MRLKYTEIGQVRKQKQQAQTTQLWGRGVEERTTAAGEGSNIKEENQIVKGRLDEQGLPEQGELAFRDGGALPAL